MSPTPWQTSRGKVAFFHLCCCISGLWAIRVVAPPSVSPVLGQRQTLECRLDAGADFTLAQSSWERRLPNGSAIVAVYNPTYGVSVPPEFVHRLHFRSPSSRDSAIVLEKVGFADEGVYTCKVSTYPLGNAQASVTVRVLAEPKVYVSTGTTPLMDGGNETTVATCVAERARPPAAVSWESNLLGRSEVQLFDVDGTATTIVRYLWRPTRSVWRHSLTCVVRHPTLTDDVRLPYRLDVQFAPEISVAGYDGEWNVGRGDVRLTCRAYANPPAHRFRWSRLDGDMPEGVQILNGELLFPRPLQKNDSGVYRCEVANAVDLRSRDLRILIRDPPSLASTVTAPVRSTSVDDKLHVHPGSPTLQALPESNVATAVGVASFLLLLCAGGVWYLRKRRRFRGELQKALSQRQNLHAADASADGSRRSRDRHPEERGDPELERRRADDGAQSYTRAMRGDGHRGDQRRPRQGELDFCGPAQQPRRPIDATNNGARYEPNEDGVGDDVSDGEGSVIARR
ncbi:nectin-3-like protein isoform X1 [Syngnathoides biaculeatus]|uniref:nectin-3-like protein isoform X1 n=1 Tax=Syngnathoides biaculeatus TaxID=300417 RepID=UPI002ADE8EDD|nr:nectin-3-like protein isoform X1 [Syngnathoides biaculeatus]